MKPVDETSADPHVPGPAGEAGDVQGEAVPAGAHMPEPPPAQPDRPEGDAAVEAEPAGQPAAEDDAGGNGREDLVARAAAAETQAAEYLDMLQRLRADFVNFRRRAEADQARSRQAGAAAFVRSLLPVVDNLERALASAADGSGLRQGVEQTIKQLRGVLTDAGVEEIDPRGAAFDPQLHEAMLQMPADGVAAGHVAQVLEKGYKMGEQLLRPARVAVAGTGEEQSHG